STRADSGTATNLRYKRTRVARRERNRTQDAAPPCCTTGRFRGQCPNAPPLLSKGSDSVFTNDTGLMSRNRLTLVINARQRQDNVSVASHFASRHGRVLRGD